MLNHEIFCLDGRMLIDIGSLVAHLHARLGLLKHAKLQAPNLVLDVPVVLLELAVLNDLHHQLLELIVFDLL